MLIDIVHLLWIVPLSAAIGMIAAAMCIQSKKSDEEMEKREEIIDEEWSREE